MKIHILILLLIIANLNLLQANDAIEIAISAKCSDSKSTSSTERFSITVNSSLLNLSKDAVQDNTGGYVNIPEDKYYFKTDKSVYRLKGTVDRSTQDSINQFSSTIYAEEFYNLKNSKNIQLIQKINLEYRNNKSNVIDVYFDKDRFDKAHQKCQEQINSSTKEFYLQSILLVLFILGVIFFIIKKIKKLRK